MKAWHFTGDTLRNHDSIPAIGEKLVHDGELNMCEHGLHASKRIIDALVYAPGNQLHRVEMSGKIVHGDDKMVASERTILWSIDCEGVLRRFAILYCPDSRHAPVVKRLTDSWEYAGWVASKSANDTARAASAWGLADVDAWFAAYRAARATQNRRLTSMVMAEYRRQSWTI